MQYKINNVLIKQFILNKFVYAIPDYTRTTSVINGISYIKSLNKISRKTSHAIPSQLSYHLKNTINIIKYIVHDKYLKDVNGSRNGSVDIGDSG